MACANPLAMGEHDGILGLELAIGSWTYLIGRNRFNTWEPTPPPHTHLPPARETSMKGAGKDYEKTLTSKASFVAVSAPNTLPMGSVNADCACALIEKKKNEISLRNEYARRV